MLITGRSLARPPQNDPCTTSAPHKLGMPSAQGAAPAQTQTTQLRITYPTAWCMIPDP